MLASIGFEIETQWFSPLQENKPLILSNPSFFYKISLDSKTYVYPDEFTRETSFAKNHVNPFLDSKRQSTKSKVLKLGDGSLFTIQTPLESVFRNTEFVVTFKKWEKVEDLLVFIYTSFQKAVETVELALLEFQPLGDILDIEFPYRFAWRHKSKPLVLFSQKEDLGSAQYATQCTLGIPVTCAIQVFTRLSQEFMTVTGITRYHEHLMEILQTVENIFFTQGRDIFLENYLFLFLYSYRTRGKRKSGVLFNVRHLFQNIWKYCFSRETRDDLFQRLRPTNVDVDFIDYFQRVHYTSRLSENTGLVVQDMEKVGILPFYTKTKTFYFEFRGFSQIIKQKCSTGETKRRTLQRMKQVG